MFNIQPGFAHHPNIRSNQEPLIYRVQGRDTDDTPGTGFYLNVYSDDSFIVDWGDGSIEKFDSHSTSNSPIFHDYASTSQIYTVKVYGTSFTLTNKYDISGWACRIKRVVQFGNATINSMYKAFAYNLSGVRIDCPSPVFGTNVTMEECFYNTLLNPGTYINNWNTSTVTDLTNTFNNCSYANKNTVPYQGGNIQLGGWDVSNVTSMSGTFKNESFPFGGSPNVYYRMNPEGLEYWDTSSVTDLSYFAHRNYSFGVYDTASLPTWTMPEGPTGQIGNWNVGNVTDLTFALATSFIYNSATTNYDGWNGDVSSWNTSNVTTMEGCFESGVYSGSVSGWDVSNVTNMSKMFRNTREFVGNMSSWNVSNVTDMSEMFENALKFNNSSITGWNTGNVTNMSQMFQSSIFNHDINNWDVSSVTNMSQMFLGSSYAQYLNFWDTGNVTNMSGMFRFAAYSNAINAWDTSNVTDMSYMLYDCDADPGASWNTSNVTNMSYMLASTSNNIFEVDISGWDTGNVTNMSGMFQHRYPNSQVIDISGWNTSNVTDMSFMFQYSGFTGIGSNYLKLISGYSGNACASGVQFIDTGNVTTMESMFQTQVGSGCINTTSNPILYFDTSNVTNMDNMFNGAFAMDIDISDWCVPNISSTPTGFATGTNTSLFPTSKQPSWGTCPVSGYGTCP